MTDDDASPISRAIVRDYRTTACVAQLSSRSLTGTVDAMRFVGENRSALRGGTLPILLITVLE